ncbi:transporter substrate-binding domain-containing protein [Spirillospora sp. NPDC052242]
MIARLRGSFYRRHRTALTAGAGLVAVLMGIALVWFLDQDTSVSSGPPASTSSPDPGSIFSKPRIAIAFKDDQPGLSYSAPGGKWAGFEYDLGQYLAARLKVKTVPLGVSSDRRLGVLEEGKADLVIATFSYTDTLATKIEMAGPYMIVSQGVLVRSDDHEIHTVKDLRGKTVCAAAGSTSLKEIQKEAYGIADIEQPEYSSCVQLLRKGKVEAVSTDESILYGFVQRYPNDVKVVRGANLGELSRYMIGLPLGHKADCARVANVLADFVRSEQWRDLVRSHLHAMTGAMTDFENTVKPVPETVKCWT